MLSWLRRIVRGIERRALSVSATRGAYHFLVSQWEGISDLEVLRDVIEGDYFRERLKPVALPVSSVRSVVVLAPHQDDETIGAGGTLLLASENGARIEIVWITDGAQENAGGSSDEVVRLRRAEAERAAHALGAHARELGVSNLRPRPSRAEVERLGSLIREARPDVVMLPWLLDGPVKHRMVNHLFALAHRMCGGFDTEVWSYQVHTGLFPNGYVDFTDVAPRKREILGYFRSQNEQFRRYDHIAMGMAAWNSRFVSSSPPTPRYLELFFCVPAGDYVTLLNSHYLSDLDAVYKGATGLAEHMRALDDLVARRSAESPRTPTG